MVLIGLCCYGLCDVWVEGYVDGDDIEIDDVDDGEGDGE